MKLILIRHFVAEGNLRHAYIGRTDDPLADCPENERLRQKEYPQAEVLVASPLLRCRQTAEWIYHRKPDIVAEELREMDFGEFENKNYEELKDDPRYRAWLELEGEGITPGGFHWPDQAWLSETFGTVAGRTGRQRSGGGTWRHDHGGAVGSDREGRFLL